MQQTTYSVFMPPLINAGLGLTRDVARNTRLFWQHMQRTLRQRPRRLHDGLLLLIVLGGDICIQEGCVKNSL